MKAMDVGQRPESEIQQKNHVERAIIMAAGTGTRMRPVTLTTPKPLIRVKGVRMIDTVIQALHENGIYEIYVVVGYRKEQFACLTAEYKGVTLIENPYWDSCNNIASLYVAREQLENAMILDGDQIIYKKEILAPEFTHSGYNAVWTDEKTDEWLMQVKDGIVCSCSRTGGKDGWQLFSVSRWNREDGKRLKRHLELEFEKKQIASGGAGGVQDFVDLFREIPDMSAGLAASIFHFGEVAIPDLKQVLRENGVCVRL